MDKEELRQFLLDSNAAGFAGGEEKKWIKEADGSTTIPFEKGLWKSHDNFFGGEPYGGRVVVFYKGQAVWMMVYYGWVAEGVESNPVYGILKNALKKMPEDNPYRGPVRYEEGEFIYQNSWRGEIDRYFGEEVINKNGKLVFKTSYFGGLVDVKKT